MYLPQALTWTFSPAEWISKMPILPACQRAPKNITCQMKTNKGYYKGAKRVFWHSVSFFFLGLLELEFIWLQENCLTRNHTITVEQQWEEANLNLQQRIWRCISYPTQLQFWAPLSPKTLRLVSSPLTLFCHFLQLRITHGQYGLYTQVVHWSLILCAQNWNWRRDITM